jgi:maltooligosyltrehalose trehalohydrolase
MKNGVVATGPRGAIPIGTNGIVWRVWAPQAGRVDLVLLDGPERHAVPMDREGDGTFTCHRPEVPDGQRYLFRLNDEVDRPDPASRWQPEGVNGPSAVVRPERFTWSATDWGGVWREELIFYEIHVGTFTREGTFEAIIPRLHRLRSLGVTALELMPVGQFPGGRNWGYDGVFPYAPQNTYGGPHGLQRLVDACHAEGLALFLDVVYNHLGPEGNHLREFGSYFSDRHTTPWGPAVNFDGPGSAAVRAFVLENVRTWLEDYRLDGLRVDAVHAIRDAGPVHILTEIQRSADEVERRRSWPAHVFAESDLNDVKLLRPTAEGGWGVAGQWSDDFHHGVHAFLTGERQGCYVDYGRPDDVARALREPFLLDGAWSRHRGRHHGTPAGGQPGDRFVVSLQNHDHVGNRARGDRLTTLIDPPRQRLAASLLLLAPHLPLLFMGQEYGEDRPFPFFCSFDDPQLAEKVRAGRRREFAAFAWQGEVPDPQAEATFASARLSWSWPSGSPRKAMRRLYRHLLAARRVWPALTDFGPRSSRLLPVPDGPGMIEMVRGGAAATPGRTLRAFFNLGDRPVPLPTLTNWERVLFRSESERYGGAGGVVGHEVRAFECVVVGPTEWPHLV